MLRTSAEQVRFARICDNKCKMAQLQRTPSEKYHYAIQRDIVISRVTSRTKRPGPNAECDSANWTPRFSPLALRYIHDTRVIPEASVSRAAMMHDDPNARNRRGIVRGTTAKRKSKYCIREKKYGKIVIPYLFRILLGVIPSFNVILVLSLTLRH